MKQTKSFKLKPLKLRKTIQKRANLASLFSKGGINTSKILIFICILMALSPYAYGAAIRGWSELKYSGNLSINATQNLNLVTNSSSRMYIAEAGNIGIGTASPSSKLHVVGNLNVSGTAYLNSMTFEGGNLSAELGTFTNLNVTGAAYLGATTLELGNITPNLNNTYSLGSPTKWWKDLYVSNNSIYIAGTALSTSASGVLMWNGTAISNVAVQTGNNTVLGSAADEKVGIGISSPSEKLSVAGNASINKTFYVLENGNVGIGTAAPASKLHVEGLCVAENTLISMADGTKKKVTDVKEGDEVLSLDEETNKIVSNKVMALLDMGNKTIFEVTTESGRSINTTGNHPYLTPKGWVKISELKEGDGIAAPRIDSNYLADFSTCFNPTKVNPTISPDFECLANIPEPMSRVKAGFGLPNDMYSASAPSSYSQDTCLGFSTVNFSILSTSVLNCLHNERLQQNHHNHSPLYTQQQDIYPLLQELCRISSEQEGFQHPLSEQSLDWIESLRSSLESSSFQDDYLQYASCALLSALLERHSLKMQASSDEINEKDYLKLLIKNNNKSVPPAQAAASTQEQSEQIGIFFDRIVSIKVLPPQHVYDLMIENTHNFIANDIIAHNTYINGGLNATGGLNVSGGAYIGGNVGIGTTGPTSKLHVIGNTNVSQNLTVEGQCVTGDTLLSMADGAVKKIIDVEAGDFVLSLNEETQKIGPRRINGLLDMGIKPVFNLTTEDGRSVRTTGNHPYLTKEGWVKVKELSAGTKIAVPVTLNLQSEFMASNHNPKSLSKSDVESILTLSCFFNSLSSDQIAQLNFNANAKKSESSGSGLIDFASVMNSEYSFSLANLTTTLSNFSINRNCVSDKENLLRISDLCSLISPKEKDGECNSKSGKNESSLAFDLSLKKENNSVVSTTSRIYTSPICLSLSNLPFLILLPSLTNSDLVNCLAPFITSSMNRESNLRFSCEDINSSTSLSIFVDSPLSKSGILTINSAIITSPKGHDEEKYLKLSINNPTQPTPSCQPTATSASPQDIKWVKIKSIEYVGEEQVYDIEVEGTHNFIANGIVAHNTYMSGNVGIGTTAPSTTLHVQGSERITGTLTLGTTLFPGILLRMEGTVTTSGGLNRGLNPGMTLASAATGDTMQMVLIDGAFSKGTGHTGLLTSGLQISPSFSGDGTVSQYAGISLTEQTAATANVGLLMGAHPGGSTNYSIYTNSANNVYLGTGNVGIGTTGPRGALDVRSANVILNSGAGQIFVGTTATSQTTGEGGQIGLGTYLTGVSAQYPFAIIKGIAEGGTNNGALLFATMDSASTNLERMRITSTGNVGIGTTAPLSLFHVAGTGTVTLGVAGATHGTINSADNLYFNIDSNNDGTTNAFVVGHDGTAIQSELFRIQENGNVGINDSTPSTTLDVGGYIRYDGAIEYSPVYVGDALSEIKQITYEQGTKEGDWADVNHNSLPEGVRVDVHEQGWLKDKATGEEIRKDDLMPEIEQAFKEVEQEKTKGIRGIQAEPQQEETRKQKIKDKIKNKNYNSTEELIQNEYEAIEKDVPGRDVGKSIQLNTRAIQQIIEILETGNYTIQQTVQPVIDESMINETIKKLIDETVVPAQNITNIITFADGGYIKDNSTHLILGHD